MAVSTDLAVLLVHGAFADASGWSAVIRRLQSEGVTVTAPANPLRGVGTDGAYLASVVEQAGRPVLLVGHSYGGVTITSAAAMTRNVVGLVYVAALAPDRGESAMQLTGRFPDTPMSQALRPATYPGPDGEPLPEFYLHEGRWPEIMAAGVVNEITAAAAVSQRPAAAGTFQEPLTTAPAWRSLPSWYVIADQDRSLHPEAQRFMAHRAGAETVEVRSPHAVAVAHPKIVIDRILAAARQITDKEEADA